MMLKPIGGPIGFLIAVALITFLSVHERIHPAPQQASSPKRDFADLLKNRPWKSMFVCRKSRTARLRWKGSRPSPSTRR